MHIMGALAEPERGLIVERTQAGIQERRSAEFTLAGGRLWPLRKSIMWGALEHGIAPRSRAHAFMWLR